MTAVRELLNEVAQHGGRLIPDGDRIRVTAPAPLPDDLMARLRERKPELLRLLADPSAPCTACGCGSYWQDADGWHCEGCTPAPDHVTRWRNVSGGAVAPIPAPAVAWPADMVADLRRVAAAFDWSRQDVADFTAWARRSPQALADAGVFLRREAALIKTVPAGCR